MKLALTWNAVRNCWFARMNGTLFVLPERAVTANPSVHREYMIVARLGKHPNGYLIEPVTDKHVLVEHTGFEMTGSMCRTQAYRTDTLKPITPGRVQDLLPVAENINIGWSAPVFNESDYETGFKTKSWFNAANFRRNDDTRKGACYGWYKHSYVEPTKGSVYITIGESRACGLPEPPGWAKQASASAVKDAVAA